MFRFSISTLLVGVLAVGLGCAALANPSPMLEKIVVTAVLALLGIATLWGLYLPRATKAFYGGFAVSGWLYFAIVTLPLSTETDLALGMAPQNLKDRLLTTDCLRLLDPILAKPEPAPDVPKQLRIGVTQTGDGIYMLNPEYYHPYPQPMEDRSAFYNIGQLLFVMLFGAVGGALAQGWQKAAGRDVRSESESSDN